jgi:curli production assembly/transport component CsgE
MKLWQRAGSAVLICVVGNYAFAQATPAQSEQIPKHDAVDARETNASTTADPALESSVKNVDRSLDIDIDGGVVINQTITVAGQDFYHFFVSAWRDLENSEHYNLAVRERPSARLGSEVTIEFKQRRVFHAYLPPARASIKPASIAAATTAYQAVVQADLERQLIRDPDLGRDEL